MCQARSASCSRFAPVFRKPFPGAPSSLSMHWQPLRMHRLLSKPGSRQRRTGRVIAQTGQTASLVTRSTGAETVGSANRCSCNGCKGNNRAVEGGDFRSGFCRWVSALERKFGELGQSANRCSCNGCKGNNRAVEGGDFRSGFCRWVSALERKFGELGQFGAPKRRDFWVSPGRRTASAGRLARRGSIEPTHALDRCRADGNCREVLTPINPSGDFFEDED